MRGLQQIDDVAKYIPGLSLAQREPGGTTIVFRGVASSGIQFGAVSLLGALPRRAADHAERAQPGSALHRHRANRGSARSSGHALRRELAVRDAARDHREARSLRLRCLGGSAGYGHPGRRDWLRRQRHGEHPARRRPHLVAPRRLRGRRRGFHRQCLSVSPLGNLDPGCRARHVRQLERRRRRRQQHRDERARARHCASTSARTSTRRSGSSTRTWSRTATATCRKASAT